MTKFWRMTGRASSAVLVGLGFSSQPVCADDWSMHLTVDNEFRVYFGSAAATSFYAGDGTFWGNTYNFAATNRPPSDFVYVVTASDQTQAQGFIGEFTNTTTSVTALTGGPAWQVFPAGAYAATNPFAPLPWPPSQMPTQAQIDTAIAYATANNLWVTPTSPPGYTNGVGPWGLRPNIPAAAAWIWYDSGRNGGPPSPLIGSFNHDEFLVFRIRGAGTPVCYANCDGSTTPPILNINDFICFQTKFAAGDPYANCDGSTVPPVLNVSDFTCFINRYAAGCP